MEFHTESSNTGLFGQIRKRLLEGADQKYQEFHQSLVPGQDMAPILGCRVPFLRSLGKEIAKNSGRQYIQALQEAGLLYYEELVLWGVIIGYLKCNQDERTQLLDSFVPRIENWAVCDVSCATYKFMGKDRDFWFSYLNNYLKSTREYEIRFALVCLLDFFVTEHFIDRILDILVQVEHEGYYVKMAAAWAISVCFVKFPEKTRPLLAAGQLDPKTRQKAIQKIRDSYRVSKEEKEWLKQL